MNYFNFGYLRKAFTIFAMIAVAGCISADKTDNGKLIAEGNSLRLIKNGKPVVIKVSSCFNGFGWIDDNNIFVASQPDTESAALAVIELYDTKTNKLSPITVVDGGESVHFDINKNNHMVLFNAEGVDASDVKLNSSGNMVYNTPPYQILLGKIIGDNFKYVTIFKSVNSTENVKWIDDYTYSYGKGAASQKIPQNINWDSVKN